MGESGWTPPLPLESNANTEAPEDFNTKPVLIRARVPEWGTVHEITARLELVGHGFERTLVRLQTSADACWTASCRSAGGLCWEVNAQHCDIRCHITGRPAAAPADLMQLPRLYWQCLLEFAAVWSCPCQCQMSKTFTAGIEAGALPGHLKSDRHPAAAHAAAQRRCAAVLCRRCALSGDTRWSAQGRGPPCGQAVLWPGAAATRPALGN